MEAAPRAHTKRSQADGLTSSEGALNRGQDSNGSELQVVDG